MTEIWKDVPSVPGMFASSLGRIRIEPYEAQMPKGGVRRYETKPTYGQWDGKRYILARKIGGRTKTYRVAPLVCEAFHGPKPAGKAIVCLHRDEDARNNKPSNLKWGTQRENLNFPGFLDYCRSRTGINSSYAKWLKKERALFDHNTLPLFRAAHN